MSVFKEFKEFALKGNVLDLAVAVVIGAAFTKIVNSLVQDIMMPLIGFLIGGINFAQYDLVLSPAKVQDGKEVAPAVLLNLGTFLTAIVDFLIVALAIFLFVKLIGRIIKRRASDSKD